jgi:hypothetical protein
MNVIKMPDDNTGGLVLVQTIIFLTSRYMLISKV